MIILFILALLPNFAYATDLTLESASAILIDADSGKILFEKNSHERRAPASVTKLMTLLVAIEAIKEGRGSYDDIVVASENAWRLGGSQIYLEPGEEMSLKELLIAIAVGSANDACVAVAEHLFGTHEAFVEVMNNKAKELGLNDSMFINSYGLPAENHYTSAYDIAQIGRAALKHEEILQLTTIKHYRLRENTKNPFQLDNTNKLLWWYKGADGFKTGWIGEDSGFCLASTAEKEGLRLISVVLGAPQRNGNFRDSMVLFNHGFASYQYKEFLKEGQEVTELKIGKGSQDFITGVTKERVGLMIPKGKGEGFATQVEIAPIVHAPIEKGQVVGKISILKENEIIKQFDIVAKESVAKGSIWRQYKKLFRDIVDFD
ncbi:MAG: D-Ala-D-Ala carboxypeptidase [Peptococcaceae bacterium BICA1-8]|nr:MAG: D-Ala-D-Ala carboxypeptidase [Peptococcaceae bacterium BICA1-8]